MTLEVDSRTRTLLPRLERLLARLVAEYEWDYDYDPDYEEMHDLWWEIVRLRSDSKPDNSGFA